MIAVNRTLIFIVSVFTASCTHLFYQPKHHMIYDPASFGYKYFDVEFKSMDGTYLHGWLFPSAETGKEVGTIVQFHGNAENITTHFLSLAWITKSGYNLFIFDYQGYGLSGGKHTQKNMNNDAVAALKWALDFNKRREAENGVGLKLVAYGQSLGGAIIARAISDFEERNAIDSVVLESAFYSYHSIALEKLAQRWFLWALQPLAYLLVSNAYSPEQKIKDISPIPLLVIHGDADFVVDVSNGRKIFELAREPKTYWEIKGGKHIQAMTKSENGYREKLLEYLNNL